MSLLMDALKKAEQEKKEAAKRLKHTGPNPIADTGEHRTLSSGSLENTGPHEMTVSQEMDLSLEPLDGRQQAPAQDFTDEGPVIDNTSEMEITRDEKIAESDVSGETPIQENTQEMSAEVPPVMDRGAALSLDNTLDELLDEEDYGIPFEEDDYGFDETLDSVTASQLLEDIGGGREQPTPVAANTVFEASRTNQWALGSRWAAGGVVALLLMILGGVIIHYQTTPSIMKIPKPVALPGEIQAQQAALAALPKPVLPPEPGVSEMPPSAGAIETTPASEEQAGTVVADESVAAAMTEPPASSVSTPGQAAETLAAEAPAMAEPAPEAQSAPIPVEASAAADTSMALAEPQAALTPILPARPVNTEMIRISRSKPAPASSSSIQQAYQAYQAGDLGKAEALYRSTLSDNPDNRDALLGLAAIKLRQNDKAAAFLIYRDLLRLNPKDKVARLAMLRMRGQPDPVSNESLLKLMLAEKPDSPHLYFSLGTLYASQLKWAAAQQAFFEAFTLESTNPDYALNLAVSLDHMGQTRAARKYYEQAVDLADRYPASFTTADVLARIKTINEAQRS